MFKTGDTRLAIGYLNSEFSSNPGLRDFGLP
jgi:hypothetical protein